MERYFFKDDLNVSRLNKHDLIAYLGPDCSFDTYIAQYRLAINMLIVEVEDRKVALNGVSLPLLFMIRHFFELTSKRFIFWFERRFDVGLPELKLNGNSHKISMLSKNLLKYLNEFSHHISGDQEKEILKQFIESMADLSGILEVVDDNSYQLRYHINTNKVTCFDANFQINCQALLSNYYAYNKLDNIVWAFTDYFPDPD